MAWKPLHLSASAGAHLPALLISEAFTAASYTVHLTDLTYIWSECLDRRDIIRRSRAEDTSIDPSDNEQLQILLHAYDSRESIAYTRDHILTTLPLTNAQKERVVEDSLRGARAARRAWPTQAMLEDIRSDARRINIPTLVLSGERDQVDPTARLREELLPCIPDSQLQILSQVGHLPMLEAPDVVARAARSALRDPAAADWVVRDPTAARRWA